MKLTTRPLTDRAFIGASPRERSKFTASWSNTLDLLEREVYALQTRGMDDPVLMVDCTEQDLRIDGQLRANARLGTNAVALAFESRRGPLLFRCDRYNARPYSRDGMQELWQHNLRAIALTLEALRAVDRYGATESGEQYVGYRAIEGRQEWSPAQARDELLSIVGKEYARLPNDHLVKRARRTSHPDVHGGQRDLWDIVERASRVLGVA